ncbi:MAG: BLUF domain-containing protein [Bacteroidota bacterium]
MLVNLVYLSHREPHCDSKEIDNILSACHKNNQNLNVTGVLLYSDTRFVQYLEGENDPVFELYHKIKKDDRHKNVALITNELINERAFPSWQMGAKMVDFNSIDFRTKMNMEEQKEFGRILGGQESTQALILLKKFFK